ncbi:CidA/LrgA family protein, partial [Acinetobacter baumannii]|nr:CidA/LrgA family protein [Acinetobacter baumannii]
MSTESASGTPTQPSLFVLVKQILILAGFWWIGYLLHQKLGVPVSAGILGMF